MGFMLAALTASAEAEQFQIVVHPTWRRQMTKRRVHPPPTRSSDEDVLAFVAATTGAVGYVSADVAIPDGVRVVALVD
jgi:hypothetical protein